MKRTLDTFVKVGEPIHFPCTIEPDKTNDNMYIVRLITPDASSKKGIEYRQSVHVFTEKELIRATTRYVAEYASIDGLALEVLERALLGYVGTRTYENKNGVLTTRFLVRFDGSHVTGLGASSYTGMFTSRELARSMDRMTWANKNFHCSFCRTLWRMLHHV